MDSDYERNFVFTEADGSIVPHLLLFGVQMAALAAPAFPGRRSICCFAIVVLAITANLNRFTDDPGLAQFFSLAWPHYLSVLEKLWFSASPGPERFFWRIDRPEQEGRLMRPFGFSKLVWAFVIWFNLRGIRWNYQVKNIPEGPPPTQGKWAFVRGRVIAFIRLLLMADVLSQLATTNFYTSPDGSVGAVNSRYLTTRHSSFACQVYRTASVGLIPYTFMNLQYVGGAILWVTLGISQPAVRTSPPANVHCSRPIGLAAFLREAFAGHERTSILGQVLAPDDPSGKLQIHVQTRAIAFPG